MKKTVLFVSVIMAILSLTSCKTSGGKTTEIDSSAISQEGITAVVSSLDVDVFCIQDKVTQHPAELFEGSFNDSLLHALVPDGAQSSINVFFVRNIDHNVLVDAGLGADKGGNLLAKLNYLNVKPDEIDAILLTHLHPDHIGGLLKDGEALFKNATVYLSVDEFNAWSDDGEMSSNNALWKEVLASYATRIQPIVDGDTLLDGLAVAHLATGHTPGHTVYQVGKCLMAGDLIHAQDIQIEYPQFCAKYDNDFAKSVENRQRFLNYAKQEGLFLCGAHCYKIGIL